MAVAAKRSGYVEHLVPRMFASMSTDKFPELAALLTGPVVHAAAKLTSELLREHKPDLYAHMSSHAPNHRLFDDALWTTGRLVLMRAGQSMPRHADKENMPGTDGADLMLTFGAVGGAELVMHFAEGEPVVVRGAQTILADFLNEHELGVMTGSGLRVAFVFWQQRTVVLSDHAINALDACVFPGTLPMGPVVHYFWYDLSGADNVALRELTILSLKSTAKHHPTVWIWGYQDFSNLPPGVVRKEASELLPLADFKHAMTVGATKFIEQNRADEPGRNVAQLSDLFRALALQRYGGWWLDADTVVLRKLPTTDPYYFPTVAQKRVGGGYLDPSEKVEANRLKWAGKNTKYADWDGCDVFQSTPLYIAEPNTPLAGLWVERLRVQVLSERTLKWSDTIKTMEACVVELELNKHVHPPTAFCPWPFWQRDHALSADKLETANDVYGVRVPSVSEVLERSFVVQFFFMSIEKSETSRRDDEWFHREVMSKECAARRILQTATATSPVAIEDDVAMAEAPAAPVDAAAAAPVASAAAAANAAAAPAPVAAPVAALVPAAPVTAAAPAAPAANPVAAAPARIAAANAVANSTTHALTPTNPLLTAFKQDEIDAVTQCVKQPTNISVDDVLGTPVDLEKVSDIVYALTNPTPGVPLGGILFEGDAGTGKTMMAKAITAMATGAVFLQIGATELSNPKRINALFAVCQALAPSVVLIDECDGIMSAASATTQRLGALKTAWQTDGSGPRTLVIGATNHADVIDPSVRRRFAYEVKFKLPDPATRAKIFERSLCRLSIEHALGDAAFAALAEATEGKTGAYITDVVLAGVVQRHLRRNHGVVPIPPLRLADFHEHLSDEQIRAVEAASPDSGREQRRAEKAAQEAIAALEDAKKRANELLVGEDGARVAALAPDAIGRLAEELRTTTLPTPPHQLSAISTVTPPQTSRDEWKVVMLQRLSNGGLQVADQSDYPKSIRKLIGDRVDSFVVVATTPETYASLGVPDDNRARAGMMLRRLIGEVSSDNRTIKANLTKPGGTSQYTWYVLTTDGMTELRSAASNASAVDLDKSIWEAGLRHKIDKEVQKQLAEQGLACCETCTMPVLDPNDSQFNEKVAIIERVGLRGVQIAPCGCGMSHVVV